ANLDKESRAILDAYSTGVNAYLTDHKGSELSLEYTILKILAPHYQVEPWTPVNTLTWAKAMAWDLRGNMEEEIQRAILLRTLSPQEVDFLYPPYPQDHPVIVPQFGAAGNQANGESVIEKSLQEIYQRASIPFETAIANIAPLDQLLGMGKGLGSNSWVVGGTHTASGKPILANDPHLGIQMPSIWYQIGLHCHPKNDACPFEVSGFSFAGVPGVVIGHNDRIAWGFTNVGPDVIDLYIEKVNPQNPNQYEVNGKWVDFETHQEKINLANGKSKTITVRISRHGPIISDTYAPLEDKVNPKDKTAQPFRERAGIPLPQQYAIAMRWTALQPSQVFKAIWGFDKAKNWDEFRQSASGFAVPAQNLVYADMDGNIGYQMPGLVPIRKNGDGRLPVPGWNDDYEWSGYIPFEKLPYTLNPPAGYIVTANNRVPP
ncbi:MAG: penicillin acylase family protein, partial [Anaerolineales bacterium]